jgi:hypothetical protein
MTTSTGNQDGEKQVSGSSEVQDEKPNVQAVEYAPASRIDEEFQWTIGKFIAVTVSHPVVLFAMMNRLTKFTVDMDALRNGHPLRRRNR